ncbi:uncharacterized protein LOC124818793 [Hydra vulgaris]|uniref:uncharacterized protein LOC124818793 n=1 Tax=Hydra vulgaris TaxID=6087 RepID=UPI0032EA2403
METRKIRKRKHSFIYESEVADDEVEDNFQESETGNTNICSITKQTPPDHLMAIQSSSGLHMSKYLNNPHSIHLIASLVFYTLVFCPINQKLSWKHQFTC